MVIYKTTNKINGKVYIGQTVYNLKTRKRQHLSYAQHGKDTYFYRALRKYNVDNFKWQVICICPDINSLNEQEQYYIALYDSMNNGYNMTTGGFNSFHSEESKQNYEEKIMVCMVCIGMARRTLSTEKHFHQNQ